MGDVDHHQAQYDTTGRPGTFRVADVIEEARALIAGTKTVFLSMAAFSLAAFLVAIAIAASSAISWTTIVLLGVALYFVSAMVQAGMVTAGLHRASGRPVSFDLLFRHTDKWGRILVLALLGSLFNGAAGFVLNVGAGVVATFVTVLLSFAMAFVVDRNAGVVDALTGGWRIVAANASDALLFMLLAFVLGILGAITLGIAYLWIVPFLNIAVGLIYARTVGIVAA